MKKALALFCLLLTLTACGQQGTEISEPPVENSQQTEVPAPESDIPAEVPAAPAEAPEAEAEPEPAPEPVPEGPALPPLPLPVYCYEDTAVDARGQVLLQLPDHRLQVLNDALTGQPRGITAIDPRTSAIVSLYNLAGEVIYEDLGAAVVGWYADLFWYGGPMGYTVRCLSEDKILYENMGLVSMAGDTLLVQPPFWNTSCVLLNGSGEVIRELDRSFRLVTTYPEADRTYLVMEGKDGRQALADPDGNTYLGRFYDEICQVLGSKAVVRDGASWLAVDLDSGEILHRAQQPFTMLSDTALLAEDQDQVQWLTDYAGQKRYDRPLSDCLFFDADQDGTMDWVSLRETRDDVRHTVILDLQGQELLALPAEPTAMEVVTPQLLFTAISTGEGAFYQNGTLHNLYTNEELPLLTGRFLQAQPIHASEQELLLCQGLMASNEVFSQLFTLDGEELLADEDIIAYAGGDVFLTSDGLLCLNGTWLYQK